MIQKLLEGIRVCDLGCGEGLACLLMAQAFPRSFFVGMDVDPEVTRKARYEAADLGLTNISFRTEDAARIVTDNVDAEAYDYITAFDAVHDQTRPREALDGVYHMLRPGGVFSMIDIAARTEPDQNTDHPMGPFLYTVSLMHCMPVGLGDGTGEGLGMMWGREKAEAMLRDAGFSDVTVSEIPNDPFNLHYLCRKA